MAKKTSKAGYNTVKMAKKRGYYKVLGVKRSATKEEIGESYRRLALKYHPDRKGDETAVVRFKEATEAFEVLNHAEKRAKYDRFGFQGLQGGDAPHFRDVSDICEAPNRRKQPTPKRKAAKQTKSADSVPSPKMESRSKPSPAKK